MLGHDDAAKGWVDERWRKMALELNRLANDAVHDRPLTSADVARARQIANEFESSFHLVPRAPRKPQTQDAARPQVGTGSPSFPVLTPLGIAIGIAALLLVCAACSMVLVYTAFQPIGDFY